MYYKDQFGNVTEFSSTEHAGQYPPGGVDYHPLSSREDFTFHDMENWVDKYKLYFVGSLVVLLIIVVIIWLYRNNKNSYRKSAASVFY